MEDQSPFVQLRTVVWVCHRFILESLRSPNGTSSNSVARTTSSCLDTMIWAPVLLLIQLVSANDTRVAAYGHGASIYTIIPYAIGSVLNVVCTALVDGYLDITEMELASDTIPAQSTENAPAVPLSPSGRASDDTAETATGKEASLLVEMASEVIFMEMQAGLLQFALYLAVVGGITRFRNGISTSEQRGWFMSWALLGTLYGFLPMMGQLDDDEGVKIYKISHRSSKL
jgi:hypothetical protein